MSLCKLSDLLDEIVTEGSWAYYDTHNYNTFSELIENSLDVIKEILMEGGKYDKETTPRVIKEYIEPTEESKDFLELIQVSAEYRLKHTISIYFLGLLIYSKCGVIKESIDTLINEINESYQNTTDDINIDRSFEYHWFQICFFHDLAYLCEELSTDQFYGYLTQIEIAMINDGLPDLIKDGEAFSYASKIIPPQVSMNWRRYEEYRYSYCKVKDHGIIGGKLFYIDRYRQYHKLKRERGRDEFEYNGVGWSNNLLENNQLSIAWVILAHNIWYADAQNEKSKELYKKNALDELIINDQIIKYKEYPLLFLLSLVDTIDPIKKRANFEVNDGRLDSIIYKIDSTEINIMDNEIDFKFNHLKQMEFCGFLKKDVAYWLGIEVSNEEEILRIKFKD